MDSEFNNLIIFEKLKKVDELCLSIIKVENKTSKTRIIKIIIKMSRHTHGCTFLYLSCIRVRVT